MHWHVEDTIVVLKEVPRPQPWCNQCNMLIAWEEMTAGYLGTTTCKSGGKHKHHHLAATASQVAAGTELQAHDQVLEKLVTFN